ncbi:hypothetical protein [Streptomyces sp. NPDC004266]|uniref:hypothetical protein n=1 Tax=Streptomyces sp. NPDC004266 TaxID=3364693 RepID=UPI00368EACFD
MDGAPFWWVVVALLLGIASTHLSAFVDTRSKRAERHAIFREELVRRREEFELRHLVEVSQLLRVLRERQNDLAVSKFQPLQPEVGEEEVRRRNEAAFHEARNAEDALSAQVGFILDDRVRVLVLKAVHVISDRVGRVYLADPRPRFVEMSRMADELGRQTAEFEEESRAVEAAYEAISARVRDLYVRGAGT